MKSKNEIFFLLGISLAFSKNLTSEEHQGYTIGLKGQYDNPQKKIIFSKKNVYYVLGVTVVTAIAVANESSNPSSNTRWCCINFR